VTKTIGIRREDKNEWERRVPLIPSDIAELGADVARFVVQPSPIRIFKDGDYRDAGIEVLEDLDPADVVIAVKEIPIELLRPDKVYVFFAHVIKGQPYNMALLARLLELRCTLIDYEKIANDRGQRLIFFGLHAGYAGMIETLWALGQRLKAEGIESPLAEVRQSYEYDGLEAAKEHLREIGPRLEPIDGRPLVIGLAGYGNVSKGAQEVLDCLPHTEVSVDDLAGASGSDAAVVKVVFREEHMVRPREGAFELQDYYQHPEKYDGCFEEHLPHLDVLVNTIYWEDRYPRLVTRAWAKGQPAPRLRIIGDISCDVEGSVELTVEATHPDKPCFTYDARTDSVAMGIADRGIVIMAVDNLPCELPRASSRYFSNVLKPMVKELAAADYAAGFDALALPPHLKRAVITHKGELTPDYQYLRTHLDQA
jgi:saccharopine dehydrogenase (NAD+, L-lysine-forming)